MYFNKNESIFIEENIISAGESVRTVPVRFLRAPRAGARGEGGAGGQQANEGIELAGAKRLQNAFWDHSLVDIYQQCRPDIMHSLAIGMDSHFISAVVYTVSDNLRIETGERRSNPEQT